MQATLRIEGLAAGFGNVSVLSDINFEVMPGELLLLAGPNGAGKSTLLRTVVGLHKPTAGRIFLEGREITSMSPHKRARHHCAWIPEGRGVIRELSVEDNLDLAKFVPGWTTERRTVSYDRFPILARTRGRAAGTLSGGEQQMLALARALETAPKVLLIDEPSLGLAPKIVGEVMEIMRQLRDEGQCILLVEQRAAQVQHVASRVMLMRQGRLSEASTDIEFAELNLTDFTGHSEGGTRHA